MAQLTLTVRNPQGAPIVAAYVAFVQQGVTLQTLATDSNGQITLDSVDDAGLLAPGVVAMVTSSQGNYSFPAASIAVGSYTVSVAPGISKTVLVVAAIGIAVLVLHKS